jgi:hypothetical protein
MWFEREAGHEKAEEENVKFKAQSVSIQEEPTMQVQTSPILLAVEM